MGVDVFFVISGYLITSIILRDCEAGKFSLLNFYQRRIARIFPAFFTVALCTLLGAFLIYTPQDFASAGANMAAATLSVANMKYMFQGTYFEISPDAQPYLHYWSLSVEEQFYLIFPLFLLLAFKWARAKLSLILIFLCVVSFVACLIMTSWKPVWAFYLLPTRGWQLLAGCILAVVTTYRVKSSPKVWHAWIPWVGLALILISFLVVHEGPHFPGWWALLPTLGAVAVIWPIHQKSGIVERCLSHPWMVRIGRMSYSLYLWHWPIFSLVDYQMYTASEPVRVSLKIGLSLIASVLSLHWIENPSRAFLNKSKARRLAYASVSVVLVVCVCLGVWVRKNNYIDASRRDVANGGLIYGSKPNAGTVVLMGDSNGSMYGGMLKDVCRDLGRKFVVTSMAAGDSLPAVTGEDPQLWTDALAVVKHKKPEFLVLACRWESALNKREKRFDRAIQLLRPHVKHIIVFNQPPTLPPHATRSDMRDGMRPPFHEEAAKRSLRLKANAYLKQSASGNVEILDVASYFENSKGAVSFWDDQGRQNYHDSTHLSGYGAEVIRPKLIELLQME